MEISHCKAIIWAVLIMTAVFAGLVVTFWLPDMDLSSAFATIVVQWTNTGSALGTLFVNLILIGWLVFRARAPWRQRVKAIAVHVLILTVLQGGSALINEYWLKPAFEIPRPDIVWLADHGALMMTAEEFYQSMNAQERSAYLNKELTDPGFQAIALAPSVRAHWIHETGYSLPSGHAVAAMLTATYFLAMAMARKEKHRRWIIYGLPSWAALVAFSRVLLRVHRTQDVLVGALLGIILGVIACGITQKFLRKLIPPTADAVQQVVALRNRVS